MHNLPKKKDSAFAHSHSKSQSRICGNWKPIDHIMLNQPFFGRFLVLSRYRVRINADLRLKLSLGADHGFLLGGDGRRRTVVDHQVLADVLGVPDPKDN